jgi:hypothetical protein
LAKQTIHWYGASGKAYKYYIHPIRNDFRDLPGNYMFTKQTALGDWIPLYIGESESLQGRLSNHDKMPCVTGNGGTHIHVHISPADTAVRRDEEADLLRRWDPPCNRE